VGLGISEEGERVWLKVVNRPQEGWLDNEKEGPELRFPDDLGEIGKSGTRFAEKGGERGRHQGRVQNNVAAGGQALGGEYSFSQKGGRARGTSRKKNLGGGGGPSRKKTGRKINLGGNSKSEALKPGLLDQEKEGF